MPLTGLFMMQELRLAAVGLQKAPDLPLPNLVHLNISSNGMTQIPFGSFAMMRSLRVLDLSNNAFPEVRPRGAYREQYPAGIYERRSWPDLSAMWNFRI